MLDVAFIQIGTLNVMLRSKWFRVLMSMGDPRTYLHGLRLIHYYGYSHVQPRRKMEIGEGTGMAPNVS
ncbi:MAG TPA: hypothetical protein VF258_08810, partial [Luteolibacter sp.]